MLELQASNVTPEYRKRVLLSIAESRRLLAKSRLALAEEAENAALDLEDPAQVAFHTQQADFLAKHIHDLECRLNPNLKGRFSK